MKMIAKESFGLMDVLQPGVDLGHAALMEHPLLCVGKRGLNILRIISHFSFIVTSMKWLQSAENLAGGV